MGLLDIFQPTNQWAANAPGGFGAQPSQFAQWVKANPYALSAIGQSVSSIGRGMVGHGSDMGGLVAGINDAVTAAGGPIAENMALQRQQNEQAKQVKQAQQQQNRTVAWLQQKGQKDLADAVQNGMISGGDAFKLAMGSGANPAADPASVAEYKFYANQEMQAGRQPASYADWRKGANQTVRAGMGAPIWGKNRKSGEYMPFEPMSDGTISSLVDPNAKAGDFIFDPGTVASDKAAGAAFGTQQGGAQFTLPKMKQDVEQEIANIDKIAADTQGLEETFGRFAGIWPQQWSPTMPGTAKADFAPKLAQVVGQNFLNAYSTLRGAGAITEQEGAKAQEAMGRMSTAQSKEAFLTALQDLKAVLVAGYQRMSGQAAMGPYQSTGYTPPPLAGQNFVYNPATGELEAQ